MIVCAARPDVATSKSVFIIATMRYSMLYACSIVFSLVEAHKSRLSKRVYNLNKGCTSVVLVLATAC